MGLQNREPLVVLIDYPTDGFDEPLQSIRSEVIYPLECSETGGQLYVVETNWKHRRSASPPGQPLCYLNFLQSPSPNKL